MSQSFAAGRPTPATMRSGREEQVCVALLTGGNDKHYTVGLATALVAKGVFVEIVGSDDLVSPVFENNPRIAFSNLRGDQDPKADFKTKVTRVILYYARLLRFAGRTRARLFHILWNNKFQWFDRSLLLCYYKLLGRRVVFTAHNVNAAKRDSVDTFGNRLTLWIQYKLVDHIFVHTNKMRDELESEFGVRANKISVIPYGFNNSLPQTPLSAVRAKEQLGLGTGEFTMLLFGLIAPYKGVEYLLAALSTLTERRRERYRLIIAGKPKWDDAYWNRMKRIIMEKGLEKEILQRIKFIPDEETELYFKAADVLVLPYTDIFQSGVLFMAYSFGLPVIATDVGSLREDVVEARTGFVCPPRDPEALAQTILKYFDNELYRNLETHRPRIIAYANERYSWTKAADITKDVYARLLSERGATVVLPRSS